MTIEKQIASRTLNRLDSIAARIEKLKAEGKLNPKVAAELLHNVDTFADKLQIAAYGKGNFMAFQAKVAKVIQKDPDEKYMDTYDNPNKVIESDSDEPYMHKTEQSFNAKAIDNYDQDRTTTVSERSEYQVRDLNEHAGGTKKQPSWSGGSAGKSTKQGAARSAARSAPVVPPKKWAD